MPPSHHALCFLAMKRAKEELHQGCNVSTWLWGFVLVSFSLARIGGTAAVAAGGGRNGRCWRCAAAQGFSDVGHEEGVTGQLQHIHPVLFVVSQATSNEGL